MTYTSKSSSEIKDIIKELEDLLYENRFSAPGDTVYYNGTRYTVGELRNQLKEDIQFWEERLESALKNEGQKPKSFWAKRAEGWL